MAATQDEIDAITRGIMAAIKKRLEGMDEQIALLRARADTADAMVAALQKQIAPDGSKGLRDRLKG